MDDLQTVLKLKKKLNEAVEQGKEEGYILKVLSRLSKVPMTIELLQNTQIGRDVNGLRKLSSAIKTESKTLVQKWKRLLPPAESVPPSQPEHPTTSQHTTHTTERDITTTTSSSKSSSRKSSRTKAAGSSSKKDSSLDSFSKALLGMPVPEEHDTDCIETDFSPPTLTQSTGAVSTQSHRTTPTPTQLHRVAHKQAHSLPVPEPATKQRSLSPRPVRPNDTSPIPSHTSSTTRKRKVETSGGLDAVALSKRSRTQVYSGKKAIAGPQSVPPLFDMCIKVLIDNIDAIEEVGGIPFYILEPVLSKCTAEQLLRLEEYNPHFTEDSDPLWQKHCCKDFKGVSPKSPQTWKELYIDQVELREMKLKKLTAKITATQKAREEPIRKMMSTVATRKPGRRGARSSEPIFFPVKRSNPLTQKVKAGPLMKQTMKMAQQRNSMIHFKPSRR